MERVRYMGRSDYFKTFSCEIKRIDEHDLKGYVSFVKIEEVNQPLIIGETCLLDDGHSIINFLPDGKHWYLHAIYDKNGAIIEWYFDITKKNSIDQEGNPYCDDLYLDVALLPNGQIIILDEDELESALNDGEITQNEFDLAYDTLKVLEGEFLDVSFMESLCTRFQSLFDA